VFKYKALVRGRAGFRATLESCSALDILETVEEVVRAQTEFCADLEEAKECVGAVILGPAGLAVRIVAPVSLDSGGASVSQYWCDCLDDSEKPALVGSACDTEFPIFGDFLSAQKAAVKKFQECPEVFGHDLGEE